MNDLGHPKLEAWIETFTGKTFHFLGPTEDEIDIEDIATSLSNECRFGGHTHQYYSVAEHSLLVAALVGPEDRLAALLHDASEAYIRDIASPVKQYLSNYKELEDGIMKVIAKKYGFDYPLKPTIKEADTVALKAEARALLPSKGSTWVHLYPTSYETDMAPICMVPPLAKKMFLQAFNELQGKPTLWTPEREILLADTGRTQRAHR